MAKNFSQLRYLGMVSQPEYSEYGFRVETEDKSTRLLTLTIANSVFRSKQLMIQEAPDLCFQKILAELRNEAGDPFPEQIVISESDIVEYRASHPNTKPPRRSFRKTPE